MVQADELLDKLVDVWVGMNLPFNSIEHNSFKSLVQFLNPNAKLPSRHTIQRRVHTRAEDLRKQLRDEIPKNQTVSLCMDSWTTAFKNHSLCGIYVNFIDAHWMLKSRMLDAVDVSEDHHSTSVTHKIAQTLVGYNLHDRVEFFTADNGPGMSPQDLRENIVKVLREHGKDGTVVPVYKHVPCIAHVLQLVVGDILTLVSTTKKFSTLATEVAEEEFDRAIVQERNRRPREEDEDGEWMGIEVLRERLKHTKRPTAIMRAMFKVSI